MGEPFPFRLPGSGVGVLCRRLLHLQRWQHQLIPMVVEQTVMKHAGDNLSLLQVAQRNLALPQSLSQLIAIGFRVEESELMISFLVS